MTFIIAEISGNHGGDLYKAQELIRAAEKCGCDAVKFQLYTADDLGEQYDAATNICIPVDWVPILFETAYKAGIPLFASVFHPTAIGVLHNFTPFAYKIASPESTRLKDETYRQIAEAVDNEYAKLFVSAGAGQQEWAHSLRPDLIFYCKQGYPATLDYQDLRYIEDIRAFSDHTAGIKETLAAIKLGASHIEKHLRLDADCIDRDFAITPEEMKWLCRVA